MPESLSIDGISLNIPGAWRIRDLVPMLDLSVRGEDVLIPGAPGVVPGRRRLDVLVVSLQLMIFGHRDSAGAPHTDVRQGVYENIAYLNSNVLAPVGSGDGTRAAILTLPDASTYTADVHVLPPMNVGSLSNGFVRGVLRLSVPSGQFTLVP